MNPNVTGWLVYDDSKAKPEAKLINSFDAQFDDFALVPYDKEGIYDTVDQSITLDMKMNNLNDGANYAFCKLSLLTIPLSHHLTISSQRHYLRCA